MFDRLGANESRLGLDDELAENRIFASISALNWVICDWSVRKNVQCWVICSLQEVLQIVLFGRIVDLTAGRTAEMAVHDPSVCAESARNAES
jgi:hypothetical protein